jgi:hypothetical protein
MVVVGNQARQDSQDGELGIDDQQLGNPVDEKDQLDGAGDEEEPQGNLDEWQEEDGIQDDQQEEEEAATQESSGIAGRGPFSPNLKERVRQLEKQLAHLVAGKMKPVSSFLRPADPPKYAGGNKDVIKDWLATMVQWLV